MTPLLRGRIYRAQPPGFRSPHHFLVVSNNTRNRALGSALVVRFTSTPKPSLDSIVVVPESEVLRGWIVCDDIYELFDDEVLGDSGALSPDCLRQVDAGLKAALGLR